MLTCRHTELLANITMKIHPLITTLVLLIGCQNLKSEKELEMEKLKATSDSISKSVMSTIDSIVTQEPKKEIIDTSHQLTDIESPVYNFRWVDYNDTAEPIIDTVLSLSYVENNLESFYGFNSREIEIKLDSNLILGYSSYQFLFFHLRSNS